VIIDIQITDVAGFSAEGREQVAIREAENGVRGTHPGKERVDGDGKECQGSEIVFLVHDRLLVEARGSGVCDLRFPGELIDGMDLGALPK
jgi:hypothetical protein